MSTPPGPTHQHTADPYVVLGVPRSASRRQVAEAYRRLAKRHHPDLDSDPAAADRMRRINAAWRALSDPGTRHQHPGRAASSVHWTSARTADRRGRTTTSASWAGWGPRPGDRDGSRPGRAPGLSPIPQRMTFRPPPVNADRFQDTGWAAVLAAGAMVLLLFAAAYAGSVSSSTPMS
jgi:curved DNA-binding protein CbpA